MDPVANSRPYRSELRDEQTAATRTRILDAALRVLGEGLAKVSIPAVAAEAGVSVPTVYRHFGSKAELLDAVYPHAVHRAGLDGIPDPRSIDELRPLILRIFEHLDTLDDWSRAAIASPMAAEIRHATMDSRLERIGRGVDSIDPDLAPADRDRLTRLLVVLTSSASLRMWRDHLGRTADEVADDVDWIVRAALAAARGGRP